MPIDNDYEKEVYNGDLGRVVAIDEEQGVVVVRFDDREVSDGFGELDPLVPAFATPIHKSQGSEYPAVAIPVVTPVVTQHDPMQQRNLLYSGVTRGKRLVVLVGQRRAIATAVHRAVAGRDLRPGCGR
jgi:exodeoxyribonuclease V alpha subunit